MHHAHLTIHRAVHDAGIDPLAGLWQHGPHVDAHCTVRRRPTAGPGQHQALTHQGDGTVAANLHGFKKTREMLGAQEDRRHPLKAAISCDDASAQRNHIHRRRTGTNGLADKQFVVSGAQMHLEVLPVTHKHRLGRLVGAGIFQIALCINHVDLHDGVLQWPLLHPLNDFMGPHHRTAFLDFMAQCQQHRIHGVERTFHVALKCNAEVFGVALGLSHMNFTLVPQVNYQHAPDAGYQHGAGNGRTPNEGRDLK